jgi:hypothetical protein
MNSCEKSLHIPRRLPDEVAEAFVRDARCKMQDASLISLTSSAVQWTGDNCCIDVACAQLVPTYVVYNYSSLISGHRRHPVADRPPRTCCPTSQIRTGMMCWPTIGGASMCRVRHMDLGREHDHAQAARRTRRANHTRKSRLRAGSCHALHMRRRRRGHLPRSCCPTSQSRTRTSAGCRSDAHMCHGLRMGVKHTHQAARRTHRASPTRKSRRHADSCHALHMRRRRKDHPPRSCCPTTSGGNCTGGKGRQWKYTEPGRAPWLAVRPTAPGRQIRGSAVQWHSSASTAAAAQRTPARRQRVSHWCIHTPLSSSKLD